MYSSLSLPASRSASAQDVHQLAAGGRLAGAGGDRRELVERAVDLGADRLRAGAELAQDGPDDALGLLEQRDEQVLGLRLGVVAGGRHRDGGLQRLLGLDREAVELAWAFLNLSRVTEILAAAASSPVRQSSLAALAAPAATAPRPRPEESSSPEPELSSSSTVGGGRRARRWRGRRGRPRRARRRRRPACAARRLGGAASASRRRRSPRGASSSPALERLRGEADALGRERARRVGDAGGEHDAGERRARIQSSDAAHAWRTVARGRLSAGQRAGP